MRGAGMPLRCFFFGAPEKSSSTATRFAGLRVVFAALRPCFLFLLDFATKRPPSVNGQVPFRRPSASSGTGKPQRPMKPARQGESADQGGHSYLTDIDQDQPWLGQKFAAQEGNERTQQDDCNHTEQNPSPPGQA